MWGCTFWFPHASSRGWWVGWDVKHTCSFPLPLRTAMRLDASFLFMAFAMCSSQLSAMDVSVRTTMKGAAKCDMHCELQNSVNQWRPERTLRFRDTPESMPASVSMRPCASGASCLAWYRCCVCLRAMEPSCPWCAQLLSCSHVAQFAKHPQCSYLRCNGKRLVNEAPFALIPRHEVRSANPLNLSI